MFNIICTKQQNLIPYVTVYPAKDQIFLVLYVIYIALWHISMGKAFTQLLTTISHEFVMVQIALLGMVYI